MTITHFYKIKPSKLFNISNILKHSISSTTFNPSIEKDLAGEFPQKYDWSQVEKGWQDWWEEKSLFKPSAQKCDSKEVFSMVIPPPNITGDLHLGHALTASIQDSLIRWNRMNGKEVSWTAGCDHAGIATQAILEKRIKKKFNQTRNEIGKEKFFSEALIWQEEKISTIYSQLKRLGASLDFDRAVYTLDEHMSKGVRQAFIKLFDDGLIYRHNYMINWCCQLQSVISDIEIEHLSLNGPTNINVPGHSKPVKFGVLEQFAYPLSDSSGEIMVSTTRIETMLGDKAICVHPDDPRHKHLIGKTVVHPFTNEHLPILSDVIVKQELGSGALKVTPSHSLVDYNLALKHKLSLTEVIDDNGNIFESIPQFGGINRFEAKMEIINSLTSLGLYKGSKPHPTTVPICSRSKDIVESKLKPQWFLDTKNMVKDAIDVVERKVLTFDPPSAENIWYEFLKKEYRPWCISRQLWWGHSIPVYQVQSQDNTERWIAAESEAEAITKVEKTYGFKPGTFTLKKDDDVLDTWFSSALYPFASSGWPDKFDTKAYPLSLMETGHDILFFWVARMVMLGTYLTGQLPFKKVLLHGLLLDGRGRKMSKSLGNVVDPLDVINGKTLQELQSKMPENKEIIRKNFPQGIQACGADSLRFALLLNDIKSGTITFDLTTVNVTRNFCNKIWQGVRFFLMMKEKHEVLSDYHFKPISKESTDLSGPDSWILSRLANLVINCNQYIADNDFHLATLELRQFWVQDFCDIYIEYVKSISSDVPAQLKLSHDILASTMFTFYKLLGPIMPFLAEELHHRLNYKLDQIPQSIFQSPYPESSEWSYYVNNNLEKNMVLIRKILLEVRSIKNVLKANKIQPELILSVTDTTLQSELSLLLPVLQKLSKSKSIHFVPSISHLPDWETRNISDQITMCVSFQSLPKELSQEI